MDTPASVDERRPDPAGSPDLSQGMGAVIGLLAGAVALGAAELVAALFGPGSSPIIAVGGAAVDLAPEWLRSFAIRTFGQNDKLALLIGIGVVLAVLAAILGAASGRRPRLGIWGLVVLGAIGAAAAVSRPTNGPADMIPSVAGTAPGILAYVQLRRAAELPMPSRESPRIEGFDRRRFVRTGIAAGGIAAVAGGLGKLIASRAVAADSRANARIPAPADAGSPAPAGADLGVQGVTPFITPNDRFYRVDTTLFVPAVDADTWKLRIHGMVDHERTLDYAEVLSRPAIERDVTIACVSNEVGGRYIGNARWIGAPLADLLQEVGVRPGATQLVSRSVDGFTIGTPTEVVLDGRDAMLAVAMNGEPLPLQHGFPVRMIVPGLYGYVSATKWLVDLELTTLDAYDAYWVQRGWAKEAPIKTESRIDTPRPSTSLTAGEIAVAGIAWAQHRGIERVEVRVDDGPWAEARLGAEDTIDTWRQWVYPWQATAGRHVVMVRATDGEGVTQTPDRAPPFPDGATGYHSIVVDVAP